jgi:hypothetical protein
MLLASDWNGVRRNVKVTKIRRRPLLDQLVLKNEALWIAGSKRHHEHGGERQPRG